MAADLGTGFINVLPRTDFFSAALVSKVRPALASVEAATGVTFGTVETLGVAALAGISIASVKLASDFETSMNRVQALVGVPAAEVQQLSQQVLDLAKTLPVAPTELADALYFIESAGLRGSRAMDALTASAQASAAGLGDTKDIADAVTSAMNAYASSGLTATHATDILIAAVREGKTDPAQFASVLGQVIPVAAAVGVSFDEVAAAIASSTREGLNASRAATGFRFLLTSFIRPSQQSEEALAGVGISLQDLSDSLQNRGLLATVTSLANKFDISTAAGRKLFATVVGGSRGMLAAQILVGQNAEAVQQVFQDVANSSGSLFEAFNIAGERLSFQWGTVVNQFRVAGIELGTSLLPIIKDVVGALHLLAVVVDPIAKGFGTFFGIGAAVYIITKVDQAIRNFGSSAVKAAAETAAEGEAAAVTTTEVEALTGAIGGLAGELGGMTGEIAGLTGQFEGLVASMDAVVASTEAMIAGTGGVTPFFAAEGDAASIATSQLQLFTDAEFAASGAGSAMVGGSAAAVAAMEAEGTAATVAAGQMQLFADAEVEAGGAGGLKGLLGGLGGGGAGLTGTLFGAEAGAGAATAGLAAIVATLVVAHHNIDSLNQGADDLGNEFGIAESKAADLQRAMSASLTGSGTSGFVHEWGDFFATVGAKAKEAANAYVPIRDAALAAGVSQETINKAWAEALPLLNANRASIAGWISGLKDRIVVENSIAMALGTENGLLAKHAKALEDDAKAGGKTTKEILSQNAALAAQIPGLGELIKVNLDIGKTAGDVAPLLGAMGTSAQQMGTQINAALDTRDPAQYDKLVSGYMEDARKAIADFAQTASENLNFLDDTLGQLGDNASAGEITQSFVDAQHQAEDFAANLKEIGRVGQGQGKALARYYLQAGDAVHAATIAAADPATQRKAVNAFNNQQDAVARLTGSLTNDLMPTINALQDLIDLLAQRWHITLDLKDGATPGIRNLTSEVQKLSGQRYVVNVDYVIHRLVSGPSGIDPRTGDPIYGAGAIIGGATGFVTRRPTMVVGEGRYGTPFGTGTEAVVPFDRRGRGILAEAMRRAIGENDRPMTRQVQVERSSADTADDIASAIANGLTGLSVQIVDSNLGSVMDGVIDARERHTRRMTRR